MDALTQEAVCREAWRHRSALTAYAYAWLKDWAAAEDAVQDAFVVLLKKWEEAQSLSGVAPWIRQMVRFKIMEARRARRREHAASDEALESLAASAVAQRLDEEADGLHTARIRALQDCLQRIPAHKRTMLDGYYREGHNCDQLATTTGSKPNAVAQVLSRLRKLLRECTQGRLQQEGWA